MSKLIQMRQRIKAIETIEKITHAMQLISKSTHSNLRNKLKNLLTYLKTTESLLTKVKKTIPSWNHFLYKSSTKKTEKNLIILIGSQKGLCGSFNSSLFRHLSDHIKNKDSSNIDFITIGTKAESYIKKKENLNLFLSYKNFNARTIIPLIDTISKKILDNYKNYSSITFVSTIAETFFTQKPSTTVFVPLQNEENKEVQDNTGAQDYSWHQDPHEFLDDLAKNYIATKIYYILFQSFLAEQASRFISMDSATRNAKKLLKEMKLEYNKLRQEKITKELTELSSSF